MRARHYTIALLEGCRQVVEPLPRGIERPPRHLAWRGVHELPPPLQGREIRHMQQIERRGCVLAHEGCAFRGVAGGRRLIGGGENARERCHGFFP